MTTIRRTDLPRIKRSELAKKLASVLTIIFFILFRNGSYSFVNSDSADLTPKEEFQQEAKMNFERRGSLDIAMPSTDIDQLISTIDDGNGGESDDDWAETDDIVAGPISSGNKLSRSNIAQGSGVELLSYSPADFDAKSADWSAYVGQNGMDINALLSMEEVNRRQISYDEDEVSLLNATF